MINSKAVDYIKNYHGPKIRIMEVCGTHTHEIFRLGIRGLLPENIELISGPGCPVCVTPILYIDEALSLALDHHVTICTFGDLLKVPGTKMNLSTARSYGAKVQVVYAPIDALDYARNHKDEQVCFLSIGFETTTPSDLLPLEKAIEEGIENFTLLTANKVMPYVYELMKDSCDFYLYPGHVHAVIGTGICEELTKKGISGVVTGFTANELLTAIAIGVKKFTEGKPFFVNAYPRVVKEEGAPQGVSMINKYMDLISTVWRGIGEIPESGLVLKEEYAHYDAKKRFEIKPIESKESPVCRCGEVLRGQCRPTDCPVFGKGCTPDHPIGACMVSSEGTCSAYYLYGGNHIWKS